MTEMNQFCKQCIPQYFAIKYNRYRLKSYFFDFKSPQNIYQETARIFELIDQLLTVNPLLDAPKLIEKYFLFRYVDFSKESKELREEDQDPTRKVIRKIFKAMEQINRQCFQLYMRIVYLYFHSKDTKPTPKKIEKRNQYIGQLVVDYQDLKIKTMTSDDSFVVPEFIEYAIRLYLDLKPNKKFFSTIREIIEQCDFAELYAQRIEQRIKQIEKKQAADQLKEKAQAAVKNFLQENSDKISTQSLKKSQSVNQNDKTPVKQKQVLKEQRNTHETNEKKQHVISNKQNLLMKTNSMQEVKKTLTLCKPSTAIKQRTIYSRKTYLAPKKIMVDQVSSTGSNNNEEQSFILDMWTRSYSSRCIRVEDNQDDDDGEYLVGATPKPKKKVKLQKTASGTFDENGNFKLGF